MTTREIDRNTIELKLYGAIGYWAADGESFSAMIESLESRGYKNLVLRLHSGGGSVFEGNVMYNALLNSKMRSKIIIDGMAASMASIIILAADEVEIADNALVMVHRPSGYISGNADQILSTAKLLRDLEGVFVKRYSERTGMSPADVQSKYLNGTDVWLNAEEAVTAGFASKVVPATAKDIKKFDAAQSYKTDDIYDRFAASLNIDTNTIQMKQELINKYKLEGVTADSSDAEIMAALDKKLAQTQQAPVDALLIAAGVPEADREKYRSIATTMGIEAMQGVLPKPVETIRPATIASLIQTDSKLKDVGDKDWNWYQANAPRELEKMQLDNPEKFAALYKAEYGVDPA